MGCPQSKQKNKDITNIGSNVSENGGTRRRDIVSPADNSKPREPTKHPHEFNDDPMAKGRADVYEPSLDNFDMDDEGEDEKKVPDDAPTVKVNNNGVANGKVKEPAQTETVEAERQSIEGKPSSKKEEQIDSAVHIFQSDISRSASPVNIHPGEEKVIKDQGKEVKDLIDVFVPDDSDSIDGAGDEKPVDINQVDVDVREKKIHHVKYGQLTSNDESVFIADEDKIEPALSASKQLSPREMSADSEVSMRNVNEGKQATLDTADGYVYKESPAADFGSQNVRHFNKDRESLEYGLPEGVPKPAPPKSKKADLIQPGTFTRADNLVDQSPDDNIFGSMQKLSSYLTGEVKKGELEKDDDSTDGKNLPPIRPTNTRKKDIIKDVEMFRKIDENAKRTPENVKMSVKKLAEHLCSVATTDLEKTRAFYYWICNNIGYMYDKSKKTTDFLRYDAASTLRQGQGSFVHLMTALCKAVNIPVVTISGCSKGLRHEPEKQFQVAERNHSWNAVYINSEWRFIDCTWGSGFLDMTGKFRRQFDKFWFLTDPEVFVYDHFPTHEVWQLLEEPVDIDQFNSQPSFTEKSRELGFQLISHREPIIYFQEEVTVEFGTKEIPLSNITADLRDSEGREVNRHRCMVKVDNKLFSVRVVPPEAGQYALILYGKAKDYRHAKFMKLMEYVLRCDHVYTEKVIFPDHLKAWGAEPNYADHGFAKSIEELSVFKSDTNEITISLEQTRNISIIPELKAVSNLKKELKDYAMVTAKPNEKTVHVRFPNAGYYKLDIYAEREDEKYDFCAAFLLQCTVSDTPVKLPKYNASSICKNVCELIEPLTQEIPADSTVVFRIKSDSLRSAMVGIPMEKDYGSRLKSMGELVKQGDEFLAQIETPKKGETIYLSGCAAPPNVFWSRLYEFVTV